MRRRSRQRRGTRKTQPDQRHPARSRCLAAAAFGALLEDTGVDGVRESFRRRGKRRLQRQVGEGNSSLDPAIPGCAQHGILRGVRAKFLGWACSAVPRALSAPGVPGVANASPRAGMDWSRRGFRRPASGRRRASGREQLEFIMAGKTKDREFRHPDVAAYLRGLTGEAAKRSLVIREPDGVCTEYWREGGRVRCREVGAGEASGGPAPELRALLAAAEAAFGRSLPRMKAEPGGGRVPDPAPSRRRSATACWIPGRGAARPFWRRSTPSFRPRPARAAAGRWSGTAGSGRRSWRASDGSGSSANK